jgi:hypothetical protein
MSRTQQSPGAHVVESAGELLIAMKVCIGSLAGGDDPIENRRLKALSVISPSTIDAFLELRIP